MKKEAIEIKKAIDSSEKILLHCHPEPDSDSIGSVLAMKRYLKSLGKDTTAIIGDSKYPTNLMTAFPLETEIEEKSMKDINLIDYDLFIILDSASLSQISRETDIIFPSTLKTIAIDHHKSNTKFADINLVLDDYSSTTMVLYDLFEELGIKVDKEMALYLFLGLYFDTGGFQFPYTSPHSFEVATKLTKINPHFHQAVFDVGNSKKEEELILMGLALSSISKHCGGKVVLSSLPYATLQKHGISREDAATYGVIPSTLKTVIGWDIAASLVEAEPNITKITFRTRDQNRYDVSKIATNVGEGGGGHAGAAGTRVLGNIEEAKKELLEYIEKNVL